MTQLGPYQLVRRLGAGGSAEVFLARGPNPRGAEYVALKLILPHLAEDVGHRSMLIREARLVAPLRHPNVVELYEVGEVDGRPFLAMEYVAGAPLNVVTRKLRDGGQRLSLSEACHAVRQAALGLHHAHEARDEQGQPLGVVHRDVSPHNLMVSADGQVKVVDFGLARATHAGATMTGGLKGKLRYMPPEQLRSQALDRRTDVFALGAVLWDLALGTPLYPGPTEADIFQQALFAPQPHPDELARGLPRAFVDVLIRAVERDAAKRITTGQELADALEPFIQPGAAEALGARTEGAAAPRRTATSSLPQQPAPPPPPTPIHTPQDARLAPALSSLPRVRKGAIPGREPQNPSRDRHTPAAKPAGRDAIPVGRDAIPVGRDAIPVGRDTVAMGRDPAAVGRDTVPVARPSFDEQRARRGPPAPEVHDDGELSEVSITAADAAPRGRRSGLLKKVAALAAIALCAGAGLALLGRGLLTERPEPEPQGSHVVRANDELAADSASSDEDAAETTSESATQATEGPGDRPAPTRRTQGTLILKSDRPALVRTSKGRELGMTPLTVRLASGRHLLELKSVDGTASTTVTVEVPKNRTIEERVVLGR